MRCRRSVGAGNVPKPTGWWATFVLRRAMAVVVITTMVVAQLVALAPAALGAGARAPVAGVSLKLSTYASAASQVTYTLEFTTSAAGELAANSGTIDIEAPVGTFPAPPGCSSAVATVTDLTTKASATTATMCFAEIGTKGDHVVFQSPVAIGGDNRVEVSIPGLDNPEGAGLHILDVATSSDGASSVGFAIVPAGSIGGLSLSRSDDAPGASAVTYTVQLTASATGALADNTGTISVQAAPGTFPPPPACSAATATVTDLTTNVSATTASMCFAEMGTKGDHVVFPSPVAIGGGNRVEVSIPGLDNPAGVGTHILTVGTSSDGARSVGYTVAAPPHDVADLSLAATSLAARATEVTYTIDFATSVSGALAATSGAIVLHAPVGTFPSAPPCGQDVATITDLATKASGQVDLCSAEQVTVSEGGAQLQLLTPVAIGLGQQAEVAITGLHNPAVPGPMVLSLWTSSDGANSVSYTITGHGIPIEALSVALSTPAARATRVTYTVDFTTSAAGGLAADWGTIQLSAPAGTFPAAPPCGLAVATVTDLSTKASGPDDLCAAQVSDGGARLQLSTPVAIGARQRAQVAITGLDNPANPGPQGMSLSTSSNSARSAPYRIVPGTSATGTSVIISNRAAGAGAVTYAVGFSASPTGALAAGSSTITVGAAPGTFLPPAMCDQETATVTDLTTKASASANSCFGTSDEEQAQFGVVVPLAVGAGDRVVVTVSGLSNPTHVGAQSLSLATSSNGVPARISFTTLAGGPVSGRVTDSEGYAVPGAEVQACPAQGGSAQGGSAQGGSAQGEQCYDTDSTAKGDFAATVPDGGYVLTAFPPETSSYVLARSTSTGMHTVSSRSGAGGISLVLKVLGPLPGHVSIGGQDGGVPVLYAFAGAPMTVRGCRHGTGEVTIRGTDSASGQNVTIVVPLLESRPGSGLYSAAIPPVWPVHGDVSFSFYIYCLEGVAPKAGLSAGGNVVTINGSGFTGATAVRFGAERAESFSVLSGTTIEAVAPPGTGTVNVSVTTPSGSTKAGPLSSYSYISLRSVAPSGGPRSGGTKVVIKGSDLGHIDTLWFGNQPVTNLKVVSQDEIRAVSPPGSGYAPITVGQVGERAAPSTLPPLFFDFGGAPVPVKRPALEAGPRVLSAGWQMSAGQGSAVQGSGRSAARAGPPPAITAPTVSLTAPALALPSQATANFGHELSAVAGGGPTKLYTSLAPLVAGSGGSLVASADAGGQVHPSLVAGPERPALTPTQRFGLTAVAILVVFGALAVARFYPPALVPALAVAAIGALAIYALIQDSRSSSSSSSSGSFGGLIDPSGTVVSTDGAPVRGATAVLEQAPTAEGPYRTANPASPGIEPHTNPEKTPANGQFHWDVISDYYKVVASAPGCHAPGQAGQKTVSTPVLPVPPPWTGLNLVLQCAHQAPAVRPAIASLSNDVAPTSGGSRVEIVGNGFTPAAQVWFGPAPSPAVSYVSPGLLVAVAPPGHGGIHVSVVTAGGRAPAGPADYLSYGAAPVVTEVSPATGPVAGGTRVTIHGSGLAGTEFVNVGNTIVTNITVKSANLVGVTMPPGTLGTVNVGVTTPVGVSAPAPGDQFTYAKPRPKH